MKRIIATLLLSVMLLSMLCACKQDAPDPTTLPTVPLVAPTETTGGTEPVTVSAAESAAAALQTLYAEAEAGTPVDFALVGAIAVDGVDVPVVWSVDVAEDLVKIVVNEDGTVTVDVNEAAAQETPFVLTATITDAQGNVQVVTFDRTLPAGIGDDPLSVIDAAYALAEGEALAQPATLTGVITEINTPWSDQYENISVVMQVAEREDKPVLCFRLKGEGAKELAVGDTITVTGTLKNYYGTIEFDAGCTLDAVVKGGNVTPSAPEDPADIINAAYQLQDQEVLPYESQLTGVITSVDTPWDDGYGNITVTIAVEGCEDKPIQCFRLKGEGAQDLAVGDTITVSGILKNYKGTIEFDAGCILNAVVKGEGTGVETPTDPAQIVQEAFALEPGQSLPYTATLTGRVMALHTPYSDYYKNVTVSIATEGQRIMCFRLKGEGADQIYVNDIITVSGTLTNYEGIIEFDAGCKLVEYIDRDDPTAPEDPAQVVDDIYELISVDGAGSCYPAELTGQIISVDTAWNDYFQNITVTMVVPTREDKPIQCYRLAGEGAADLAVGDKITVFGWLEIYKGTVQFRQGCEVMAIEKAKTPAQILEEAYALAVGEAMEDAQTLSGVVTKVNTPYSEKYGNVTVTFVVDGFEDMPVQCYRLTGDGVDQLAEGYEITVTGILSNYAGTVQFQSGCTLDAVVKGEASEPSLPAISAPTADTAYKFGLIQVNNGYTVYVTGEVSGRYLATTTDASAAADVYAEAVEGGYQFYILNGTEKSYIQIYFNSSNKISVQYSAEPSVFAFNEDTCCWATTVDGTDYYLGSYSDYDTISASKTSYINSENTGVSQFPAGFLTVSD